MSSLVARFNLHPQLDFLFTQCSLLCTKRRLVDFIVDTHVDEARELRPDTAYLSEYLERNRQEYYDGLLAVSDSNDWTGWCEFFLAAMTEQAAKNEQKARQILDLYSAKKEQVVEATRSQHSIASLDFLFDQPIFNSSDFIKGSGISDRSARRILSQLVDCGLLRTVREAKGARSAVFAFPELLNIAEGRKVF